MTVFLAVISGLPDSVAATLPEVASQPVGIIQITVNPGANFISAPLHRIHAYRGVISSATADSLTVTGTPGWTANQFGPQEGYMQFIVLVRKSAGGYEGDWWPVQSNSANSLTVQNRGQTLSTILQAGDNIEVRPLTSLKDLFGTGSSVLLNKDSVGGGGPADEDLICFVAGTGYNAQFFYHDGSLAPQGYYDQASGGGPYDGSHLTVWPDQAIMFFRKTGSTSLNVRVMGQVQVTRLTHYFQPGYNPFGTGFAGPSPVGTSGLLASVPNPPGWIPDTTGDWSNCDKMEVVSGTGFSDELFYHNSNGVVAPTGWYLASGAQDNTWPFAVGEGYFAFIKGSNPLVWRQEVP